MMRRSWFPGPSLPRSEGAMFAPVVARVILAVEVVACVRPVVQPAGGVRAVAVLRSAGRRCRTDRVGRAGGGIAR